LDTGAAATTLTPDVIKAVGYSRRDAYKESTVHTAIGKERGYWDSRRGVHRARRDDARLCSLVFLLGHKDIDGLVGMNFQRHFNFEVHPRSS
jgi:predicted aspartyl protease